MGSIKRLLALSCLLVSMASPALAQTAAPSSVATQSGSYIQPGNTSLNYPDPTTGLAHVVRPGDPLPTVTPTPASITTNQKKVAVTGTAVQLPSAGLVNGIVITANPSNAGNILVGGSSVTNAADGTGNGAVLVQGQASSFAVSNTNVLWINGTAGDWVSWEGN